MFHQKKAIQKKTRSEQLKADSIQRKENFNKNHVRSKISKQVRLFTTRILRFNLSDSATFSGTKLPRGLLADDNKVSRILIQGSKFSKEKKIVTGARCGALVAQIHILNVPGTGSSFCAPLNPANPAKAEPVDVAGEVRAPLANPPKILVAPESKLYQDPSNGILNSRTIGTNTYCSCSVRSPYWLIQTSPLCSQQ